MSQLFYTPLLYPGLDTFLLDEAESKHAVRVLRLGEGDPVQLVDGRGGLYEAVIREPNPKRVVLSVLSVEENYQPLPYRLHLAVAPTKNMDRFEWFLEKATEIGIHEITPLICARSERREVKLERLSKVAVSAMKQSLKAFLPVIHGPVRFSDFLEQAEVAGKRSERLIAHCEPGDKQYLCTAVQPGVDVIVLIGPEGDFAPEEIALAEGKGFASLSLGQSRLRTETAAVAACLEVSLLNR